MIDISKLKYGSKVKYKTKYGGELILTIETLNSNYFISKANQSIYYYDRIIEIVSTPTDIIPKTLKHITSFSGKKYTIGDRVIYVGCNSHEPKIRYGTIVDINVERTYGDIVQILGEGNTRKGWTYPQRII